ncbi:MAG: T9SS type A sorting domain-containing protein [Bacteroidales bacterium]|nr:T9SS type A sorting domain-containing protein [Bacteroidales bacterium]
MKNILSVGNFFICLSFLLSLQIKAQTYTIDFCNEGIASASSVNSSSFSAKKAFDDAILNGTNARQSNKLLSQANSEWIMYVFREGNEKKTTKYTTVARPFNTDDLKGYPRNWTFEASNDNVNRAVFDTRTGETNWNTTSSPAKTRYYQVSNENNYIYNRTHIAANNEGTAYVSIGEIEMMRSTVYTDYEDKRGNIWYFGVNAGISFNTEPPTVLVDGQLVAMEACATICDTSGNLLFYTNGYIVWNKAHSIMENGDSLMLYDPVSSYPLHQTQCLIIPSPEDSVYYVFSVPCQIKSSLSDKYFRYAIVDMRLNGGLGKVVQKNIKIGTQRVLERITAVVHANNKDIWVIIHLDQSKTFHAYLITESGIDTANPVISDIGEYVSTTRNIGYLKASPDGKKLAMAFYPVAKAHFELYDFDPATGIISNFINLGNPGNKNAYGVEFSPDGSKLYGSDYEGGNIYQWDLNAGSNDQIKNSCTLIAATTSSMGALQLAPNGKIYCAKSLKDSIGVIHHPNMKGTAANFEENAIYLEGKKSYMGLPNFIHSIMYKPAIKASYLCFGDSTQFSLSSIYMLNSVLWDFDDPVSGINNTSNLFAPKHKFSSVGTYNVKLIRYYTNSTVDTVFHVVKINPLPIVDLGKDTCLSKNITEIVLDAQNSGSSFLWNTGHTGQQLTVTDTGTYIVNVINEYSCLSSDTIRVNPCDDPLPITLYSFYAKCKTDNSVLIKWQTTSEINNDYFLLERAFYKNNFNKIAVINGSGNSNKLVEYEYTDIIPAYQNEVLYRLRQFDFDGKSENCGITAVNCNSGEYKLEIISLEKEDCGNILIHFSSNKTGYHYYKIYNLDGRLINNGKTYCDDYFNNKIKITLPNGMYLLSIENDSSFVSDKISVQN